MTHEPPQAETESGLPRKQGEFPISLPWIARVVLACAIGAAVGFAASAVIPVRSAGQSAAWLMSATGSLAATLLSIRSVHGWHLSTFADGTLVGLAAPPIFVIVTVASAFRPLADLSLGVLGDALLAMLMSFAAVLITVPCGWLAGFAYHVLLSAAERLRADPDDTA